MKLFGLLFGLLAILFSVLPSNSYAIDSMEIQTSIVDSFQLEPISGGNGGKKLFISYSLDQVIYMLAETESIVVLKHQEKAEKSNAIVMIPLTKYAHFGRPKTLKGTA